MESVSVVKYGEGMVEQLIKVFKVIEKISIIYSYFINISYSISNFQYY